MSADQVTSDGTATTPSTTVMRIVDSETISEISPAFSEISSQKENLSTNEGEEQALESHEVIELQTFSERKAWIEEKIKFLEKMPPIEVFVGLDALRTSAEEVPGLPTRAELQQWITEHDMIEKETEIFDKGELKKLRQLTKAATQRNLSPEDTDVIELTLTTIYELDKLLHLLRDRTENLELLGIRLTWEENRIAAWVDRRKFLEDLRTFLDTRARWTRSIYETSTKPEDSSYSTRRGSVTSLASVTSDSSLLSSAFSRSARFKLAELLSRDAAQFAATVSSLRHGKIAAAGKALDKLIDNSREPVPDVLLDEQDRLEEKGINDLEHIGKFIMGLVMQWRKADEIYVETMKDQIAAQNLLEEIETAKLHHPTLRQSSGFISRTDTLLKRLSLRGNPVSPASTFPRPEHSLFADQKAFNGTLAQSLATEITTATELVRKVDAAAKEYRTRYEAVKRMETILQSAHELLDTFNVVIQQLQEGVVGADGDGTPPDLMSEACLELTRHSLFLALLPSILDKATHASKGADELLRNSRAALARLNMPGVDPSFVSSAVSDMQKLAKYSKQAQAVRDAVSKRVVRLREARKIWSTMDQTFREVEDMRFRVSEEMEKQRWRQDSGGSGAPLTPESPLATSLLPGPTHAQLEEQLNQLESTLDQTVDLSLNPLCLTLEAPLKEWLIRSAHDLKASLENTRQLIGLLEAVQAQSAVMNNVRDEFNSLQIRIEDLKICLTTNIEDLLTGKLANGHADQAVRGSEIEMKMIRQEVQAFVDKLPSRVPFVAGRHPPTSAGMTFVKRRFTSVDHKLGVTSPLLPIELPFDLAQLDAVVRADSNSYSIRLHGSLEGLQRAATHFDVAGIAKDLDSALSPIINDITQVSRALSDAKTLLSNSNTQEDIPKFLDSLLTDVGEYTSNHRLRIARSFSPVRELLRRMESSAGTLDTSAREVLCGARTRAVNDAELRFKVWEEGVKALSDEISLAHHFEIQRLEGIRIAEEQRGLEEEARLAAEEAERARLEQEHLEKERMQKLEEERLAEKHREQMERERRAAEEAKRLSLERERIEAEQKAREEEERLAEAKRLQLENERAALREAERIQLNHEREEMQEKLRRMEEELVEERRLHAERERLVVERLEKETAESEKAEADERERRRLEEERVAEERHIEAEKERAMREKERVEEEEKQTKRLEEELLAEIRRLEIEKQRALREKERVDEEEKARKRLEEERQAEALRLQAEKERAMKVQAEEEEKHKVENGVEEQHLQTTKDADEDMQSATSEELCEGLSTGTEMQDEHEEFQHIDLSVIQETPSMSEELEDDVFGLRLAPSNLHLSKTQAILDLQAKILALRKRLRSISINEVVRPTKPSSPLPSEEQLKRMVRDFSAISTDVDKLPASVEETSVDAELRSLRTEMEASSTLMDQVGKLANFSKAVQLCDAALSDLLEHIDSYPAPPLAIMSSSHETQQHTSPEEQMSARLSFTRDATVHMNAKFSFVENDARTAVERSRILQTWSELEEMGTDRLGGKKSRPASVISSRTSSGRNSSISSSNPRTSKKASAYSHLSASSVSRGRLLSPPHATPRRAVSGSNESHSRSTSRLSTASSNRSVSGPLTLSSLYGSTFASRQRTTSLTASSPISTPIKRPPVTPSRSRAQTGQSKRTVSPTFSETSSHSRSFIAPSRSTTTSMSNWSRAPRQSLTSLIPRLSTPPRKSAPPPRKKYIADPKSKLDVAVGDVVNQLSVGINIEGVSETWKDQSGKYWIGNQDPKLCFCRILRSQTVMVRVGGGWSELSKFIKDHFADSFRLLSESPPAAGAQEEKWISSVTLLQGTESQRELPAHPHTPEPILPFVPSFSLSTPSGNSPRSMKSSPSTKGSPLTPLQFMRRAEPEPSSILRPVTPSKPSLRNRNLPVHTPSRSSIWRP